jgi:hypothetical protein
MQDSKTLHLLDNVRDFKRFGRLPGFENGQPYLDFEERVFVLNDEPKKDCYGLVTFSFAEKGVYKLEADIEFDVEPGEFYFAAPVAEIPNAQNCRFYYPLSGAFRVRKDFYKQTQKDVETRFFEILRDAIGNRKLKMTCWPFSSDLLNEFLKWRNLPYKIILITPEEQWYKKKQFYVHKSIEDETFYVGDNDFDLDSLFDKAEAKDLEDNGILFCDCCQLVKQYEVPKTPMLWNGTSVTEGSVYECVQKAPAFVIFNPDVETSEQKEKILSQERDCPFHYIDRDVYA